MSCMRWDYENCRFEIWEEEEEVLHILTWQLAKRGWKKLIKEWSQGNVNFHGFNMHDAGTYDCWVVDAIVQYALLWELRYG